MKSYKYSKVYLTVISVIGFFSLVFLLLGVNINDQRVIDIGGWLLVVCVFIFIYWFAGTLVRTKNLHDSISNDRFDNSLDYNKVSIDYRHDEKGRFGRDYINIEINNVSYWSVCILKNRLVSNFESIKHSYHPVNLAYKNLLNNIILELDEVLGDEK